MYPQVVNEMKRRMNFRISEFSQCSRSRDVQLLRIFKNYHPLHMLIFIMSHEDDDRAGKNPLCPLSLSSLTSPLSHHNIPLAWKSPRRKLSGVQGPFAPGRRGGQRCVEGSPCWRRTDSNSLVLALSLHYIVPRTAALICTQTRRECGMDYCPRSPAWAPGSPALIDAFQRAFA